MSARVAKQAVPREAMTLDAVMGELEALASERTKGVYLRQGAREPLFGVATGAMKPLSKRVKWDQALAEALYATGNFDAMYLAGMIADVSAMTEADFDRWMEGAYCHMVSDWIVSVSLAETDFAQAVADRWIATGKELHMSAGYSCYCWLLGNRADDAFDCDKLDAMLDVVQNTIHQSPNRARYSMNNFICTVGMSYKPLHGKAMLVAQAVGEVNVDVGKTRCAVPLAEEYIQKAVDAGRVGFKRKNVRC